jgi:hypothetical protein
VGGGGGMLPPCGGRITVALRCMVQSSVSPRPTGCHRTIKAHVRSRLLRRDRRGGILISFGLHRTGQRGINPPKSGRGSVSTDQVRLWAELNGPRSLRVCTTSECPVTLKGVGTGSPRDGTTPGTDDADPEGPASPAPSRGRRRRPRTSTNGSDI